MYRCQLAVLFALLSLLPAGCERGSDDPPVNAAAKDAQVQRDGAMLLDGAPGASAALRADLLPYQSTRSAQFVDWLPRSAGMLIRTRFADTAQLHMVGMPGGAREQLTFFADPVASASVRPLAQAPFGYILQRDEDGNENHQLYFVDWQSGESRLLTDGASRNRMARWSRSGDRFAYASTRRNGRDQDIYVGRPDGSVQAVLQKEGAWSVLEWSPDDRLLLLRRDVSAGESYLYTLTTGGGQPVLVWPADGSRGSLQHAAFAADGKGVYLSSDAGAEFARLHHLQLRMGTTAAGTVVVGSGDVRGLTAAIAWDIEQLAVSPNGETYAFVSNEDGVSRLRVRQSKSDLPLALPSLPIGVISDLSYSPEGDRLAFTLASPRAPSDVMAIELANARFQRWTTSEVGGLDRARFVGADRVRLTSFDREQFSAFVFSPHPGRHAGRRPVLIDVHGGPEAQARPTFNALRQYFVDELGIVVIEPNVRGSTGYGKRFRDLDNGLRREDAIRDIGALLDWLQTQPGMDARRVAISGASYGGYVTLASLARYGARLRAGVEMVGITSFPTFLASTANYRRVLRRSEYGDERDPVLRAFLEGASPLAQVNKINQPVLIGQGANDPRVPRSESEQMLRALRARDVPVWYLLAEDEGHGFRKKSNRDLFDATQVQFIERFLLGRAATPARRATPALPQ